MNRVEMHVGVWAGGLELPATRFEHIINQPHLL